MTDRPSDDSKQLLEQLARVPELKRRSLLKTLAIAPLASLYGSRALAASSGQTASSDSTRRSTFCVPVLPDTQYYPRYASEKMGKLFQKKYQGILPQYDNPFKTQTQWIVRNRYLLNIPFVIHVGDVVDQSWYYTAEGSQPWHANQDLVYGNQLGNGSVNKEWELASQAMQVLEDSHCPYSICAGNHDIGAIGTNIQWGPDWGVGVTGFKNDDGYQDGGFHRRNLFEPYLQVFPTARAQQQSTFGSRHHSGFHEYHVFEAEGNRFLVLSLSWRASDDALNWANQVIASNPTLPVILINHQLMGIGDDGTTAAETGYFEYLWKHLIRDNDQIFMAISGHYHGSCRVTKKNSAGHDVLLIVVDYQMSYMGGNGLMRLYEFDLTHNKIYASTFSPWVPLKPSSEINQFDVAWKTEDNHNYALDFDFQQRFAGFSDTFQVQAGTRPVGLTDIAQQLILANYTQPAQAQPVPARDSEDYPKVSGTLAHWRFFKTGVRDGTQFNFDHRSGDWPIADVSPDDANANPLFVNTWMKRNSNLLWSTDHHPASAAPGSLQFVNTKKHDSPYFTTDRNAPINTELFENGYTIEAFVKIGADFDAKKNAWMGILYRLGARWNLYSGGSGDTTMMMAISNLMEVQWEVVPVGRYTNMTCWSGSISATQWYHIAAVNDPNDDNSVILYVEGAPVLRNIASSAPGIQYVNVQTGLQMAIGCSQYGGHMDNGFLGNLGEIRLVNRPLSSDQWLTARRHTSA
ncbi:LamG-like jellyroll fold domain-containing protein [Salinisphaera sp. RV14]|uniref:LamG-like jellyroll fold domain-containing protein n=1 Tax=Salinisphaera sp. RV14 TaxID=3454140 RepID=UPI003F84015A